MPRDRPAVPPPVILERLHTSWVEIHRDAEGTIRHYLGARGTSEVNHTYPGSSASFPGLELGPPANCPLRSLHLEKARLLRVVPSCEPDYRSEPLADGASRADLLLSSLAEKELNGNEVVLQMVFRRVRPSERGSLEFSEEDFYDSEVLGPGPDPVPLPVRHADEPAYRVEIRAAVQGPDPSLASRPLLRWIDSWTSADGTAGWELLNPSRKGRSRFLRSLLDHSPP